MAEPQTPYTSQFFTNNARNSGRSARPVLGFLRELYSPTSIVDIGCGSGAWLATAGELGFTVLKGYDGPWADPARYTSSTIDFTSVNLEESNLEIAQRYDLAMSVEVAEHLSEPRSDAIVDALCAASDVVLFGAAVPGQGGAHHVNEQPQSYWVAKFEARGYRPYDVIRPLIWNNPAVMVWFKQNTLLYVKESSPVLDATRLRELEAPVYDVIHPEKYRIRVTKMTEQWGTTKRELQQANRRLRRQVERVTARNQRLLERNRALRLRNQARRERIRSLRAEVRRLDAALAARRRWSLRRLGRGVSRRVQALRNTKP